MAVDPEVTAVLVAATCGVAVGVPALVGARRRAQQSLRACLRCGRVVLLGTKTCDCED